MPRRMHNQSRRFLSHRNCLRGNQKRDMATLAYIRDLPIMPLGFVSFPGSQVHSCAATLSDASLSAHAYACRVRMTACFLSAL